MKDKKWFFCRKQSFLGFAGLFVFLYAALIALCAALPDIQAGVKVFMLLVPWHVTIYPLLLPELVAVVSCDREEAQARFFGRTLWRFSWKDVSAAEFDFGDMHTNSFIFHLRGKETERPIKIEYSKRAKQILLEFCQEEPWADSIASAGYFGRKRKK